MWQIRYTQFEWFATAIPISHKKIRMKSDSRGICGCKDWILTNNLLVPECCQKCGLVFDKL